MCTLLIWKRVHPRFVGGRDELGGGTWFAVNALGVLVALTNRRGYGPPDPARRSRGLLVADVARSRSLGAALDLVSTIAPLTYNPFVLFLADARDAYAVHCAEDGLRV